MSCNAVFGDGPEVLAGDQALGGHALKALAQKKLHHFGSGGFQLFTGAAKLVLKFRLQAETCGEFNSRHRAIADCSCSLTAKS